MDTGVRTAPPLSLEPLASQLHHATHQNLSVRMSDSIIYIENIPAYVGEPPNRWLLTQFFETAYRVGPRALGIILKDDRGFVLASTL